MLPFKSLLKFDKKSHEAVYKQIASQLVLLIQKGILIPDTQLPSTRHLAIDLGLHRKTIMAAYNDLLTEDWIVGKERKEYRVSTQLPILKPRTFTGQSNSSYKTKSVFSFDRLEHLRPLPKMAADHKVIIDDGFPEADIFPFEKVSREYKSLLTPQTLKVASSIWSIGGSQIFKEALSIFLNDTRGINIDPENVLVTRGAQMAIYIAASLIIKPGDKVLVTTPNYFLADAIFRQLGAQLISVPVDSEGADIAEVENALAIHKIKLLYIVPHHHHPMTVTLSSTRRTKLLELIRLYQLPVIEDDYDYDFQYQYGPYLPLASGEHEGNVIYIGSLTKTLGANFRLGYMISTTNLMDSAVKLKSLIDLRGDAIMEGIIASLMQSGEFSRFINKATKLYQHRCDYASALITNKLGDIIEFKKPQGGMALWLKFKEDYPLPNILHTASSLGLQLAGTTYFKGTDIAYDAIRFGFASVNEKEIEFAIDVIKRVTSK